jgi:hypothetical protein
LGFEYGITLDVVFVSIRVLTAVQFNAKPGFVAIKIRNVRRQRMLATEFEAPEPPVSQQAPYQRFRIGGSLSESPGKGDDFDGDVFVFSRRGSVSGGLNTGPLSLRERVPRRGR